MQLEKLDLKKKTHSEIFFDFYKNNEQAYKDDSLQGVIGYLNYIEQTLSRATAFVYFLKDKPYMILYACPDMRNNYDLLIFSTKKTSFFQHVKCLRSFITFLFDHKGANKIRTSVSFNEAKTELLYRYIGFIKEGMLRAEKFIKGRPVNLISLTITKRDFKFINNEFKNKDGMYHKDLGSFNKNNLKEFIKKAKEKRGK